MLSSSQQIHTPTVPFARPRSFPRRALPWGLALLAGFALGGWVMIEIVYHLIATLIAVYSESRMQLGVYNLYDHIFLYRVGFAGASLLLTPLALYALLKR